MSDNLTINSPSTQQRRQQQQQQREYKKKYEWRECMKWNHVLWSVGISNLYNIYCSHTCVFAGLFSIIFHVLFSFFFSAVWPPFQAQQCAWYFHYEFFNVPLLFLNEGTTWSHAYVQVSLMKCLRIFPLFNSYCWVFIIEFHYGIAHIFIDITCLTLFYGLNWMCSTFNDFDF